MSQLTYYNYPDIGKVQLEKFWYSQAVRVGDRIECAGQGGWDPKTGEFYKENAGGKGWEQVYRVNSYHVPINNEALEAMPIWTCVGVTRLGEDDMHVEIEVVARDPEGAKAAGSEEKR
ncbi:hypothetical protein BDW59DRAFT_173434 [Aspergillus cavernicola]|uniref:Uncharacterized protein n=1 Tax=Aspergillus cavernicola TaxID=176166 RepID=A0ABR4I6Q1_9EURO